MIYPTKKQLVFMQKELIDIFGGIHGIRDSNILDQSYHAPLQTFSDEELYPTLIKKATHLCYSLVKNHAFIDGNKRIGAHAMLVFLKLNGIELYYDDQELIDIIMGVASGKETEGDLHEWIKKHIE